MPTIKIDHIVSFSSEDPVHVANNILSTDSNRKWKCQSVGEKQAIVVLQLEKASQITAVDIGNEHSAYVEVLVSRSSSTDDYKVLLANSAFMSALEARQSQNINKVRMFTKDQLSKPECDEKWDRVKIICSQPFNRHVQFGLSFITLHSNETKNETNKPSNFVKFLIRPESPDNLSIGTLFAKRTELKVDEKPTAAAAIRDATSSSSLALYGSPTCKPKLKNRDSNSTPKKNQTKNIEQGTPKDRNRHELFYTDDEEGKNGKIDKTVKNIEDTSDKEMETDGKKRKNIWGLDIDNNPKNDAKKKKKYNDDEKNTKKEKDRFPKDVKKDVDNKDRNTPKTPRKKYIVVSPNTKNRSDSDDIKPKKTKLMKPFHELLQGVAIVISGIQNPDRANLRTMSLSMGAKYKPDWDGSCTHLICAFPNTPKFNQVKGKGKIVKKSWIETCYKERKKLPWRRFALDKNDLGKNESEDEICELVDTPTTSKKYEKEASDDSENKVEGSDTEERIAKILAKKKQKTPENKKVVKPIDGDSTDEETLNVKPEVSNKVETPRNNHNKNTVIDVSGTDKESSSKNNKITKRKGSDDDVTDEESLNVSNVKTVGLRTNPKILKDSKIDPYEADTDEEPQLLNTLQNGRLLDIFQGEKFYVDKNFDENTHKLLSKYIVAYNGKCVDDVSDDIDIIVTTKENSKKMKKANSKAKCIDQKWIFKTHSKHKLIPMNNFVF